MDPPLLNVIAETIYRQAYTYVHNISKDMEAGPYS